MYTVLTSHLKPPMFASYLLLLARFGGECKFVADPNSSDVPTASGVWLLTWTQLISNEERNISLLLSGCTVRTWPDGTR